MSSSAGSPKPQTAGRASPKDVTRPLAPTGDRKAASSRAPRHVGFRPLGSPDLKTEP